MSKLVVLNIEFFGGEHFFVLLETIFVQVGTPICIPQKDFIDIGRIASIENNHKPVDTAKKGSKVAIKVLNLEL